MADLIDEDWRAVQATGEQSSTQVIGSGCHAAGFEGMIVPSAQYADGRNIVIFPDKISKNSKIDIVSADQLPGYSG